MADEFTIDAKYKRDNLVAEHERYRRRVEELEAELVAMRGAPRDEQNDEGYALPSGRGFVGGDVGRIVTEAYHKWAKEQPWMRGDGRSFLKTMADAAVEPGANSAAYPKPESSGVAPKGEQEEVDESSASWQNGYNVGFEHAKVASPPPDRLTDEEILAVVNWLMPSHTMDEGVPPLIRSARDKLCARLADRGPE